MQPLSKCQWHFHKTRTNIPSICMEPQKTLKRQSNLESKIGSIMIPDFKVYYNQNSMILELKMDT